MVAKWIRKALGIEDLVGQLREERKLTQELMGQMARTSEVQAQAVSGMISVLDRIYKSYEVQGSPEGRHMSEEQLDRALEELYATDESE